MSERKKSEHALSEALGIEFDRHIELDRVELEAIEGEIEQFDPVPYKSTTTITTDMAPHCDEDEDYDLARNTLRHLIREGNAVLDEMKTFAREAESPRAFEVYSTMTKTIADTTGTLLDLHKKKKDLKEKEGGAANSHGTVNVDKAVFVGTTAELLEKIKGDKRG